jgi:4-amino-4-deoxy-L-arabinose transferase-like glycosyltransferase
VLSRLAGRVTEATAHAPVALAAIVAVLFTFLLGDRLFGRRAGIWAALILATTSGFLYMTQALLPDMLVLCFATLAGYLFWEQVTKPTRPGPLVMFYVAVALAVFAKGPVGLLPLLAAGVWLWTEHGLGGLRLLWTSAGVGLFALLTLIWVGPFLALGARSWVEDSVWGDWLTWYFGPLRPVEFAHSAIVWSLPWTLVLILAIACALRRWRARAVRFALLWFAVPFLVLLLSSHQKTRYLLLMYPGAALLVACWAAVHGTTGHGAERAMGWLALAAGVVMSVALHVPEWWGFEERRYLLAMPWPLLFALILGMGLVVGALFWGLHAGRPALLLHGVVIGMVLMWGASVWPLHQRYNEIWNFRQLAASVDQHGCGGSVAIYQHRDKWGPIDFYLGRSARSLSKVEHVNEYLGLANGSVVLMEDSAWKALQSQLPLNARVLHQSTIGQQTILVVGSATRYGPAACPRKGHPATEALEAL